MYKKPAWPCFLIIFLQITTVVSISSVKRDSQYCTDRITVSVSANMISLWQFDYLSCHGSCLRSFCLPYFRFFIFINLPFALLPFWYHVDFYLSPVMFVDFLSWWAFFGGFFYSFFFFCINLSSIIAT